MQEQTEPQPRVRKSPWVLSDEAVSQIEKYYDVPGWNEKFTLTEEQLQRAEPGLREHLRGKKMDLHGFESAIVEFTGNYVGNVWDKQETDIWGAAESVMEKILCRDLHNMIIAVRAATGQMRRPHIYDAWERAKEGDAAAALLLDAAEQKLSEVVLNVRTTTAEQKLTNLNLEAE